MTDDLGVSSSFGKGVFPMSVARSRALGDEGNVDWPGWGLALCLNTHSLQFAEFTNRWCHIQLQHWRTWSMPIQWMNTNVLNICNVIPYEVIQHVLVVLKHLWLRWQTGCWICCWTLMLGQSVNSWIAVVAYDLLCSFMFKYIFSGRRVCCHQFRSEQ